MFWRLKKSTNVPNKWINANVHSKWTLGRKNFPQKVSSLFFFKGQWVCLVCIRHTIHTFLSLFPYNEIVLNWKQWPFQRVGGGGLALRGHWVQINAFFKSKELKKNEKGFIEHSPNDRENISGNYSKNISSVNIARTNSPYKSAIKLPTCTHWEGYWKYHDTPIWTAGLPSSLLTARSSYCVPWREHACLATACSVQSTFNWT